MSIAPLPTVSVTRIAEFPEKYFLENLVVRADHSLLITALLQRELWYVPGPARHLTSPVLVHTFEHPITGIVEVEPDIFVLSLTEGYTTHESHLARIDLNNWTPRTRITPQIIYTFDHRVRALNGSCLLGEAVMAVADSFAGLIWRIDLGVGARTATASVWAEHDTMCDDPDGGVPWPPQPGVNGLQYGARTGYLYYTSTAQMTFMRVPVDRRTLDASGAPEFVAAITDGDDFCIDETRGFAYVTRHRVSTLDRVPLIPGHGSEVRHLLGEPLNGSLVGPSSARWGRQTGDEGRVMYVTTDGGTTAAPDGMLRNALLLRLELSSSIEDEDTMHS